MSLSKPVPPGTPPPSPPPPGPTGPQPSGPPLTAGTGSPWPSRPGGPSAPGGPTGPGRAPSTEQLLADIDATLIGLLALAYFGPAEQGTAASAAQACAAEVLLFRLRMARRAVADLRAAYEPSFTLPSPRPLRFGEGRNRLVGHVGPGGRS